MVARRARSSAGARAQARAVASGPRIVDPDGASWLFGVWVAERAREAAERERPVPVAPSAPTGSVLLARAQGLPAGSGLLVALEQVDVAELTANEAITYLQQMQRFTAFAAGLEVQTRAQVTAKVVAHVEAGFAADAAADADTRRYLAPGFVEPVQVAYAEVSAAC